MAADTKRGVGEQVVSIAGHAFTAGEVRDMLREQGLHVVTAADKAVLEAMARVTIRQDGDGHCTIPGIEWEEPLRTELARREAAK